MRINFIKNFKYFNWIQMFSDILNKFSLFKFEFLTSIMLDQPIDAKAAYEFLKSFLLIQIQGDIPIIKIFEFLKVEKIITEKITKLIPPFLLNVSTSIEFSLNTSIDEIPFEFFKSKIERENNFPKVSLNDLIKGFIPDIFIDCEDVEINFRLLRNNLKIRLNLPVQHNNFLKNENKIKKDKEDEAEKNNADVEKINDSDSDDELIDETQ